MTARASRLAREVAEKVIAPLTQVLPAYMVDNPHTKAELAALIDAELAQVREAVEQAEPFLRGYRADLPQADAWLSLMAALAALTPEEPK